MPKNLRECLKEAEKKNVAIGHFNISDLTALKAIFGAAREIKTPVIIGVSEGEREYIGTKTAAALVRSLREEYDYPIFINADHTYSLDKIKEAVAAGFDSVIFDGAKLPLEENVVRTKEVVDYVKKINPETLVEAEVGYIGSSSKLLDAIPDGAAVEGSLTTASDAEKFVKSTGVDLFAPAVGNIHGMLKNMPEPALNTARVKEISEAVKIPLVLHGGSGNSDSDFVNAIKAGIRIVHINTEIRVAWRKALESKLKESPDEVAPYKIMALAEEAVYGVTLARLKLFSGIK